MNHVEIDGYSRISKRAARKTYNQGKTIFLSPCKLSPVNIYMPAFGMSYNDHSTGIANSFDNRVNAFEYYNCNSETGNYTAFYEKEA